MVLHRPVEAAGLIGMWDFGSPPAQPHSVISALCLVFYQRSRKDVEYQNTATHAMMNTFSPDVSAQYTLPGD
jgi:hypothetical protein